MNTKILILGFGVTGESCLRYFNRLNQRCRIYDTRTSDKFKNIKKYPDNDFYFSQYDNNLLKDIESVIVSPGFDPNHPLINRIHNEGISLHTDIDIFKSIFQGKIISVTGTNGKTTVVQMIEKVLRSNDIKARACGNNGYPPLDLIEENLDYAILELSSYQLEYMSNKKSNVSIILNITDDHLDRHETIEKYVKIKKSILVDACHRIINLSLKHSVEILGVKYFGYDNSTEGIVINNKTRHNLSIKDQYLNCDGIDLSFLGYHDLQNILAVFSVMDCLGIDNQKCIKALLDFTYPPHRIELIKKSNNISWYNDSKSTNCDSTYWALRSLRKNVILIMGGSIKKQNYSVLSEIINSTVKILILTGDNSKTISNHLKVGVKIIQASNMHDAVEIANYHARSNDSIILSPASPSFDSYQDYEHRGKVFKNAVLEIAD